MAAAGNPCERQQARGRPPTGADSSSGAAEAQRQHADAEDACLAASIGSPSWKATGSGNDRGIPIATLRVIIIPDNAGVGPLRQTGVMLGGRQPPFQRNNHEPIAPPR